MNSEDVIINPKTNRPIAIGSRVHRKSIADAIYKIEERESSIMFNINEPNKEIEPFEKKKQYISVHMGKNSKKI